MKIYTKITWDIETGRLIGEESFDYSGPLALCDRGDSKAAAAQSSAQSATDQSNAQTANKQTQDTIGQYKGALANYMSNDPYQQGGEYDQNIKTLGASVSQGEENSAEGAQNSAAARMGVASSPQLAANTAEMRRESTRSFGNYMANAEQDRIAKENANRQFGVEGTLAPASTQAGLYSSSISGATGAGANQVKAAAVPGFWSEYMSAMAKGAGEAADGAAACWIAEAIYGPTIETKLVRAWLNLSFTRTLKGKITMAIYRLIGRPVAFFVRHSSILRNALKPLFDKALAHAQAELKVATKDIPRAVMPHKPQFLEVQRPDGELVSDAAQYPPVVLFPEDIDLLGDLTLAEQGMLFNIVCWQFKPLQASATWKRPHPGWFPLSPHTTPVLWEYAGCHRPEAWEEVKDRVLSKFGRSADGKWLIAPSMFMRWKLLTPETV